MWNKLQATAKTEGIIQGINGNHEIEIMVNGSHRLRKIHK
jgi:hypothetical protein